MEKRLIPPLNFSLVEDKIYRSGFPNERNFNFLLSLGLKSILHLSELSYEQNNESKIPQDVNSFALKHHINVHHLPICGHKEPAGMTDEIVVMKAINILLNKENLPVLIHCDKGKHRTGVVVGCLRKLLGWSIVSIFHEYSMFTKGSIRYLDFYFIESFIYDEDLLLSDDDDDDKKEDKIILQEKNL